MRRELASRVLVFAGFSASLRVGEKFLRLRRAAAVRSQCMVAMPTSCRRLTAWCGRAFAGAASASAAWRASASSSSSAASSRLAEACACGHRKRRPTIVGSSRGAARAARRAARHCSPRGILASADYYLPPHARQQYFVSTRQAPFSVVSDSACAGACTCFFKDFALRHLKTRKIFWPRGADGHRAECELVL